MTPYYLQFHQGTGVGVRVLLNDIPFYSGKGDENVTITAPANHLFLPGENVVVIELFDVPKPAIAPFLCGPVRFAVYVDEDGDDRTRIHYATWPDEWEEAEAKRRKARAAERSDDKLDLTPPLDPPLPYLHISRFQIDEKNPRPAYLDAPVVDFGPEGLPEQHAAVRRVFSAFQSGDADVFLDEHALKLQERQRAYPNNGSFGMAEQRKNVGDHFTKAWRVRPTEMKDLTFDRRAEGRVVHITRPLDGYALEAVSEDPEDPYFATDLFMTQHKGVWRVFR